MRELVEEQCRYRFRPASSTVRRNKVSLGRVCWVIGSVVVALELIDVIQDEQQLQRHPQSGSGYDAEGLHNY